MAKEKKIAVQDILQVFMFERIIERSSKTEHRGKFILKGGLFISAMVGIVERTTIDMDTTVKGVHMEEVEIRKAVENILRIPLDDGVVFEIKDIQPSEQGIFMIYICCFKHIRNMLIGNYYAKLHKQRQKTESPWVN